MTEHEIKLTPKERKRLLSIMTKGANKASVIRRAHILLKSNEGKTDREISELLYVHEDTVRNTRVGFARKAWKPLCKTSPIHHAKRH
ncbi:MAG: helix-turn-helix domain-containing protein [Chloroflexota bacterium]|jgi:DNA-binding NarL/FixJ family response regulator